MKTESLSTLILRRFRKRWKNGDKGYVNGGLVERFAEELGFKGSNASRRLREMCEDNLLERQEMKMEGSRVASVWYKYLPTSQELLSETMRNSLK